MSIDGIDDAYSNGESLFALMNIHHLELFYYVATHRGVSAAARHIPYGIQQPAISAQILQLEQQLGVALFRRRPFDLTDEGRELYDFIQPFFSGLPTLAEKLRGRRDMLLRIGAPATIQLYYIPHVLKRMRKRFASLDFSLSPGSQEQFEARLQEDKIDVAVCSLSGKSPPGITRQELVAVPLALLVPEGSRYQNSDQVLKLAPLSQTLICIAGVSAICKTFERELQRRKIAWSARLELESYELVARFVAQGFGVGLVLDQPDTPAPPGTRRLRLDGFSPLSYGVLWRGKATPLIDGFLQEAVRVAAQLSSTLTSTPENHAGIRGSPAL